jgi:hypothetical protein
MYWVLSHTVHAFRKEHFSLALVKIQLSPSSLEIGKGKLTVGKIYGGLLILENWKTTKFGRIPSSQRPVSGNPRTSSRQLLYFLTSLGLKAKYHST